MNNFEFITYTPTPQEKHLGIATVKLYGKMVVRYKVVKTKDGASIFPAPATYKIADQSGERYIPAFVLDSTTDNELLQQFIKDNLKRYLGSSNASNSNYMPPPIAQHNQNNQGHQQLYSSQAIGQGKQNNGIDEILPF